MLTLLILVGSQEDLTKLSTSNAGEWVSGFGIKQVKIGTMNQLVFARNFFCNLQTPILYQTFDFMLEIGF